MPAPFWSGKNATVSFFIDGSNKVPVTIESWSVKPNVTAINDGIGGEDRDRLQTITNYYQCTLNCKQVNVADLIQILANSANDDTNALPLNKGLSFLIQPNDGTYASFQFSGDITVDDWEWANSGRTDRQKLTIPLRAQYFTQVPASI
jgi:hypothetical protein